MPFAQILTPRRKTRTCWNGSVPVGSDHPVSVQSMTKTATEDAKATLAEIDRCVKLGVDVMRCAVPYNEAAKALPEILKGSAVPIVADIHFNPRMAFAAIEAGVHVIRINPGNINEPEIVAQIVDQCRDKGLAMRIGVNSGSIVPREGLTQIEIQEDMVDFMVKEALRWIEFADRRGFHNFTVSIKSSDVNETIAANRRLAPQCDVPIHLGVTHAGTPEQAKRKTALAFGTLLAEGIGDEIRVSITGSPESEVQFGCDLLADLGYRRKLIEVIACPSCGRADVNVEQFATAIENRLIKLARPVRVSFLGCAVNGPGEAADADFGIVASARFSTIYRGRHPLKKVENNVLIDEFLKLIEAEVPDPNATKTGAPAAVGAGT